MVQVFSLAFPLSIGLLGSLHCLGMCGPLVFAYSLHLDKSAGERVFVKRVFRFSGFFHHLAFHCGRLLSYGLLGAAAAGLFRAADLTRLISGVRDSMSILGGILLIFFGLALLKVVPLPAFLTSVPIGPGSVLGRWLQALFTSQGVGSKWLLGFAVGFLPCCLSWAMIVTAATTQNPLEGFLIMAAFGAGTVPALFLTGVSASLLSAKVRFFGERMAALSIIAMGITLCFRGAGIIA